MTKRCYVGNLPFKATEDDIRDFFRPSEVKQVQIIKDRDTGQPRGFAFVELASHAEVLDAVERLDQAEMGGRRITVNEANERPKRSGRN